jgi:hypothetical protein
MGVRNLYISLSNMYMYTCTFVQEIKWRKYGWIGHTLRKSQNKICHSVLEWNPQEDHVDAPKPPGGALFWRNAGKYHLANYEKSPPMEAEDGWPMLHCSMAIKKYVHVHSKVN